MLDYKTALGKLLSVVPDPSADTVPLHEGLGLVLAESVVADLDLPPFDKSFMDGFAVRTADLSGGRREFTVAGQIAAGQVPPRPVRPGEAWQIMTGAIVPEGADAVQMVEKTRRSGDSVELLEAPALGENIAPRGNEVRSGDTVLENGREIGPAEVAVLATFGRTTVRVFRRLSVGIVSTGDELVDLEAVPGAGQIRNSNAHMLHAQSVRLGLRPAILPSVPDQPDAIRAAARRGLEAHDALILSGGVSMGEFDFVHRMLAEEGVDISFHKANIKPGKPLIVGRREERMVFGLPGNPVSAFVTFELFVRPAVRKWMGFERWTLPMVQAKLTETVRQKPGRLFFMPAWTESGDEGFRTTGLATKGSADIVAFARCNSLLLFPAEREAMSAGEAVKVMLLESPGGSAGSSKNAQGSGRGRPADGKPPR